jgi:hypothetical protein
VGVVFVDVTGQFSDGLFVINCDDEDLSFAYPRCVLRIPGYPALHSNNIRHLIPEYPAPF